MITLNAVITSADVTLDRDCFLSVWLMLDYGGSGQGFGGYVLGATKDCAAGNHAAQKNIAGEFLVACMEAGGVVKLSDLAGKNIRVRKEDHFGDIIEIGHIVKDDKWFNPKARIGAMCDKDKDGGGR